MKYLKKNFILVLISFFLFINRAYILLYIHQTEIPLDSYLFISIAREITHLRYPPTKRLPFYPIILIPAVLLTDNLRYLLWVERWISVASSILTLILLYLIGRELKLEKKTLYVAMILCSIQPYYLITSIRPLSESFYTMVGLLTVYFYYRAKNTRTHVLLGFAVGLTAMTRFEGMPVAAIILAVTLFRGLKKFVAALIPFLLIVSPWLAHNMLTYGNPFYTEYTGDEGLKLVYTLQNLQENIRDVLNLILNMWADSNKHQIISVTSILLILLGVILFFKETKSRGFVVLAYVLSNLGVMLLIAHGPRLISPSIPFNALFLVYGILGFKGLEKVNPKLKIFFYVITILILVSILYTSFDETSVRLKADSTDAYRQSSYVGSLTTGGVDKAIRYIRISLGSRINMPTTCMSLEELEVYSKGSKLKLKDMDGWYWYGTPLSEGTYTYSDLPQGIDEGGVGNISFRSGDLTDGFTGESDKDSVQWLGSGNHSIVFDLMRPYQIKEITVYYQGGKDRRIDSGRVYISYDKSKWSKIGEWTDKKDYLDSEKINRTFNINDNIRYIRLDLSNTLEILKLNEVTITASDESTTDPLIVVPDQHLDYNRGVGNVSFSEGALTDGEANGLVQGTMVIWSDVYNGPIDITFDLGREYMVDEIIVRGRLRNKKFGLPKIKVKVSQDGTNYTTIKEASERIYERIG